MSKQWKIKIRRRAKHGSTKGKLLSLSDPHQVTVYLTYIRTFHLAIYFDIPSGILSGIHSDIPSGILSGILIGMLSDIEFWHLACILTFGLAYVLTFYVNAAFYLPPLSWHSFWHLFLQSLWLVITPRHAPLPPELAIGFRPRWPVRIKAYKCW